jgi:hypothetical protein
MDIRLTAISFLNVLFPIREALGIGTANPKESLNQSDHCQRGELIPIV